LKKTPTLPRCERCDLRLIPLVVQSSDFRWTAAPHRQVPDQTGRPDRPDAVRPAVPPKDDIVGWPDELLINFPDFPDCILDSVAIAPTPHPIRCPSTSLTGFPPRVLTPPAVEHLGDAVASRAQADANTA
jgi:hypothetical protein